MKMITAAAICMTGALFYGFVIFPYLANSIGLVFSMLLGLPFGIALGHIAGFLTQD